MQIIKLERRDNVTIEALVALWERSVKATHDFLDNDAISRIKTYVPTALASVETLCTISADNGIPLGFMGAQNGRLEMLFIDDTARGKGLGSQLLSYGIQQLGVCELTVNEQNLQAIAFYQHHGFSTYKRTELDEERNPYPLLYMKLQS